ncbi:MAG TPA: transcription termination/antitermination protein NusG [Bryobacteraceae bacterium]|nr:transcription termination/antitermination protein NusG [Bryobacteraceae bacterium]
MEAEENVPVHEQPDEAAADELAEPILAEAEQSIAEETVEAPAAEVAVEAAEDTAAVEEAAPEVELSAEPEAAPAAEVEPAAAQPPVAAYDESSPKKWYIIHTYSGFENKVAESLKTRSEAFGFADKIGQVLIPTEEVVELRSGKKVTSKRLVYPGYVLVEMEMNDALWHEVKNTPRVTGFVGGGNMPVPLSAEEVNQILYRQASSADRPRPKMTFEKNDSVRIIDGPFANFSGKVDEVNSERGTLRVMVTIFGRATPVELEFLQVEKV